MTFDWLLTDLGSVIPAHQCHAQARPGGWQLASYVTPDFTGRLALAQPSSGAPDIVIPLPLTGTYDLYLGMQENYCDRLQVRLSTDRAADRLRHSPEVAAANSFQCVRWRRVTLTGKETLIVSQDGGQRAAIGYVGAVQAPAAAAARGDFIVHVTDDGFPGNWGRPANDEEAVWQVEPLRRMGANLLSYGTNLCGMANYPSRHTDLLPPAAENALICGVSAAHELGMQVLADHLGRGFNLPRKLFALAKAQGLTVAAYARMAHSHCAPPYEDFRSPLFDAHPEWRCVDHDGAVISRLSVAFPEVRQSFIKLFAECVELGADAVNAVFVRGVPLVLYEEPVLAAYRAAHGGDARTVPPNDPRAQAVRAGFVTTYMREQRRALDQVKGRPRARIIATVPATREVCEFFGLDVAAWIQEGLIDVLCPYRWGFGAADTPLEMAWFASLTRGTPVKLVPFVNTWRTKTPIPLLETALELMAHPLDGLSVWDGTSRAWDFREAIATFGDRAAMTALLAELRAGLVRQPVTAINGLQTDRYHFGWVL
jgi:hypothetical protein